MSPVCLKSVCGQNLNVHCQPPESAGYMNPVCLCLIPLSSLLSSSTSWSLEALLLCFLVDSLFFSLFFCCDHALFYRFSSYSDHCFSGNGIPCARSATFQSMDLSSRSMFNELTSHIQADTNDWVNVNYVVQQSKLSSSSRSSTIDAQASIIRGAGTTAKDGPWSSSSSFITLLQNSK